MAIGPGTRVGPYEVTALIGEGGMGKVWRARHTSLKRDDALKVLPEPFCTDPERLARFRREAQVLASLNHPNIAHVYGLESAEGAQALIMELVDGLTLADRIASGRIDVDEALPIAKQIAEALEAAHEQGIIHRDLKPANVKVRPDGMVKVLDFGLAKLVDGQGPHDRPMGAKLEDSPTITSPVMTHAGVILGTAPYMSPEQVKGLTVDRRADIWAFGSLFYEMLSGRRAFRGSDTSDTLAAVLREDVDWSALPPSTPEPVRRIIARCLERDAKRRLRDIGEARVALDDAIARSDRVGSVADRAPIPTRSRWRSAMAAGMTALLASSLTAATIWYVGRGPTTATPVTRLSLDLPAGQTFSGTSRHIVAISLDGTQIVYSANNRLFIRGLAQFDARPLQGTEGDSREPVFSPDGRSIAFYSVAERSIKRVAISGGAPVVISPAEEPSGMSWGSDGIVFGQPATGIMRVRPEGGTPDAIVRVKDGQTASSPRVLPGGTHVLFTLASGPAPDRWERARLIVQSLTTGEQRTLIEGASDGRYVPTGHIVYALSGRLFAVRFDLARLAVIGDPIKIVDGIRRASGSATGSGIIVTPGARLPTNPGAGEADFSVSDTGTLVYIAGPSIAAGSAQVEIVLMDNSSALEPLKVQPGRYATPRVSPDGTRIAFASESEDGAEANIWTYDLGGTKTVRQLTLGAKNQFPVWTSDSQRVAFQSDREGDLAVFWQAADGAGAPERLTRPAPGESHVPESWSPTSRTLLFSVLKGSDVSLAQLSLPSGTITPFGNVHSATPIGAVFSPDGRWVAYSTTEAGRTTVYVQPFPATGAKYAIVPNGSDVPHHVRWTADGRALIYNARPNGNEATEVTTRPTFAFGKSTQLPRLIQGGPAGTPTPFDVMPDGRLLGFVTTGSMQFSGGSQNQIQVVLNWLQELKTLIPGA